MKPLNRSVAGIRGIWGKNLTPDVAIKYSAAFGTFLKQGKILIGRDTRFSGDILTQAAIVGLSSAGCDVTDIGVLPTPTCQLAVEKNIVDGGIVLTASHNPVEWNGLKFLNREGHFLNQEAFDSFMRIHDSNQIEYVEKPVLTNIRQGSEFNKDAIELHIHEIQKHVDVKKIREKQFQVVLDAVNGAGSRLLIPLLEQLGCTVTPVYCDESGQFLRGAEPMPEHLTTLCDKVRISGADIGFAVDPDADRLSIVTETGQALGEEMTLPLVAQHILSQIPEGSVVTNLSTSMAIDHVAGKFNRPVIRTQIGEAHVVTGMKENRCVIGGEGNGGVIFPAVHYARDTGVGVALILDYLSKAEKSISEIAGTIPHYVMIKKKIDVPLQKIPDILQKLQIKYADAEVNTVDGVKLIWKDRWLHVRKSGTEGMLRVFAESVSAEAAEDMTESTLSFIKSML